MYNTKAFETAAVVLVLFDKLFKKSHLLIGVPSVVLLHYLLKCVS